MKLLRLQLNVPFRSLAAGFEVQFLDDWNWDRSFRFSDDYKRCFEFHPYCLAGRNGSGKSNVLEALAAIFYHIECIYLDYRPEGFEFDAELNPDGFRAEEATPDAFELEYLIPNHRIVSREPWPKQDDWPVFHIRIVKKVGERPVIDWLNKLKSGEITATELTRAEVKAYLPTYILGYSSGHNEILSLPFFKMRFIHFDEYRDHLTKDVPYDGRPEGRMIYLDDQFNQAILLCHFLFPSEAVTRVFEEKIGLKGIRRFRLIIRRHHRVRIADERLETMRLSDEDQKDQSKTTIELTDKLQFELIEKLIKCSTTFYEDFSAYEDDEGSDLLLDYWVDDATRKAFQFHFGAGVGGSEELSKAASALNLFQSLQTLLTLNHYQVDDKTKAELYRSDSLYLNETIPMPASHERIMRFKDFEIIKDGVDAKLYGKALSDGEHQLIHTIGLCLLFRHEPALFLLDEPETHLNPDWRASYISTLRAALEADAATKNVMRDVLLTSHSPFIISDCRQENVLVFARNEDGKVEWNDPGFNTFGASANAITIRVFGQKESIGDYAAHKLDELRDRLAADEDPDELIENANALLGDSVEKILFINQALDRKEAK
ncbi:restriction system-associated AAA family ATPase [Noviherbaspirillum sp.]|uniref:restriction system-associated AAA family ATPase n=1 Tax=Noviherbaspirillum sp. TaxID=1926288 RepID=UPI002FDF205C